MRVLSHAALFALLLGPVALVRAQVPGPRPAHVLDVTRETVFVDLGREAGLATGDNVVLRVAGAERHARVTAVSRLHAALTVDPGAPLARGAVVAVELARTPAPTRPPRAPRGAPPLPPPWDPSLAREALPRVEAEPLDPDDADARRDTRRIEGEIALRFLALVDLESQSRSYQDLALSSQLAVDFGDGWSWEHLAEARIVSRPELGFIPFQHAEPRLDIYLARLAWAPPSARVSGELGRIVAAPGTSAGMVDGARVALAATDRVELAAFAGLRPTYRLLVPELNAPTAGVSARATLGRRGRGRIRAHVAAALAADTWRGEVDRAYASVRGDVEVGPFTLDGDVVLDVANDVTGRTGPRPSHASFGARLRTRRLDLGISTGTDRPVMSRSLAEQLPDALLAEHALGWASADASYSIGSRLVLDASVRAWMGDDGYSSGTATLGARVHDLGPTGSFASLSAEGVSGDLTRGFGGRASYDLVLSRVAHVDLSYSLHRWDIVPSGAVEWAHRARVAGDRRFGRRFRGSLSLEAAYGAGPVELLAFVLVGYSLSDERDDPTTR